MPKTRWARASELQALDQKILLLNLKFDALDTYLRSQKRQGEEDHRVQAKKKRRLNTVNVNKPVPSPQVSPQPSAVSNQRQNDKALSGPAAGGLRDRDNNRGDRDSRDRNEGTERRSEHDRLSSRSSNDLNDNTDTGSQDVGHIKPVNSYPDTHQLFVGNLPHTVTAAEIRETFSELGEPADINIPESVLKSSCLKSPSSAFDFEETSSVQPALKKTTISLKMPEGADRRLNVEEKRSRLNMESSSGSGGYFNGGDNAANSGHSASNNAGNNSPSVETTSALSFDEPSLYIEAPQFLCEVSNVENMEPRYPRRNIVKSHQTPVAHTVQKKRKPRKSSFPIAFVSYKREKPKTLQETYLVLKIKDCCNKDFFLKVNHEH